MKRVVYLLVAALIISLGAFYIYFSGKEYTIKIPENEIQEKMSEKLPITKSYFFIFQITLKNPRVVLENASNRVNGGLDIVLNIKINKNPIPLGGSIDISGKVRYESELGAFFLTDPVIESISIQGVPEKHTDKANLAVTKALNEYYSKHPIYTLRSMNGKEAATKMVLKNVVVENKELVVTLGI